MRNCVIILDSLAWTPNTARGPVHGSWKTLPQHPNAVSQHPGRRLFSTVLHITDSSPTLSKTGPRSQSCPALFSSARTHIHLLTCVFPRSSWPTDPRSLPVVQPLNASTSADGHSAVSSLSHQFPTLSLGWTSFSSTASWWMWPAAACTFPDSHPLFHAHLQKTLHPSPFTSVLILPQCPPGVPPADPPGIQVNRAPTW